MSKPIVQKVCPIVSLCSNATREILMFRHPLAGIQLVKGTVEPSKIQQMQRGANSLKKVVSSQNSRYFSSEKAPEWFADKFGIFITSICFTNEINGSISPQMMGASSCSFFGIPCRRRRQAAALCMRAC